MVQKERKTMRYREQQKEAVRSTSPPGDSRVRRASYYVWFLGAEECRGLRGPEVVRPVVQYLVEREKEHEPQKVTLQVSGRGIKLLQQGATSRSVTSSGAAKHFIPAGAITHVQQEVAPDDDIVSAVLLIYNPLTRCPVHIHCYRCDSTETAEVLKNHLQQLLQRPEQQAKLAALEGRLASRGLLPSTSRGSDGASSGSSVSSGGGSGSGRANIGDKMATLYDSLAAELREKLGGRGAPLLLPPRDYNEKPGRSRSKLQGHEVNMSGMRKSQEDDSARSSGIGSDDAPSPTQEKEYGGLEHQYSSEEEWAGHESAEVRGEGSLVLVQPPWKGRNAPPHVGARVRSPSPRRTGPPPPSQKERGRKTSPIRFNPPTKRDFSPLRIFPLRKGHNRRTKERNDSPESPKERFQDARDKFLSLERQRSAIEVSHRSLVPPELIGRSTSWEMNARSHPQIRLQDDLRRPKDGLRRSRDSYADARDDNAIWPKSDRDTGYGSRDALKERRSQRDRDSRDFDYLRRDNGRRTPDIWDYRTPQRPSSPGRNRTRTPIRDNLRVPRVKSPDRHEYMRAKSMHDLSHPRKNFEDDRRVHDPRRHSLYDPPDDSAFLRESRKAAYASQTQLPRPDSKCSSASSADADKYNELPDNKRFPGLDRATARPDPLDASRNISSRRKFEYPVNGGHPAIHIARTHHDDYRKFRYDHNNYMRSPSVPNPHY